MVYGIVAEYNPFHKGHKYLVDQVKSKDDFIIAVMSGNFVQRGDFAILPKWERAQTALANGIDVVLELPTPFVLKSAEGFAAAAMDILACTNCVDRLLFGAEEANLSALQIAADFLESDQFQKKMKQELKKGASYPAAWQKAADLPILQQPNNLLAVEYLRALKRLDTPILPVAVPRVGCGHDSTEPGAYPSASYLRQQMQGNDNIFQIRRCDTAVLSMLRRMSAPDFARIEDVSEGLENRIVQAVKTAASVPELYSLIKNKRYTHARVRRIIMRAFLNIKKDDFPAVPYLRILGFHERAIPLIKKIKTSAKLPLLQKHSDIHRLNSTCQKLYTAECSYTDQYMLGFAPVRPCGGEMTHSIIKIKE